MNGRQRIIAALSPGGTDRFAAVIPYEQIYFRDRWGDLSRRPWWHLYSPDIQQQLGWRADAAEAIGQGWFSVGASFSSTDREALRIEERPEGVFYVDDRVGSERELEPPRVGGTPDSGEVISLHVPDLPSSLEEIDAAIERPEEGRANRLVREGRDELARLMLLGFGEELFPISHCDSPLWRCYGLWGFEGLMTMIADRPELVRHACSRFLERALSDIQCARALGVMGIWIEECVLDMISPLHYRQMSLPFVRQIADAVRAEGMFGIHYFCGDPGAHWESLLDTGADALALEEGKKGFKIDIDETVERVRGRMAVLGNLDSIGVLQDGSDDELAAEVRRQLAAGRRNGGRFIMSLGSPVTPATPVSRVRAYCQIAWRG